MSLITQRIQPEIVSRLTDAEIETCADKLRSTYQSTIGIAKPCIDAQDVIWSLLQKRDGLVLDDPRYLGLDQDGNRVLGYTVGDYEGGVICIDETLNGTPRYVFTLAHELGHWTLHRALLADAFARTKECGANGMPTLECNLGLGAQTKIPSAGVPRQEWQANRFAVHLLMPGALIRESFRKRISQEPINYCQKCQRVNRFQDAHPTMRSFTLWLAGRDRPFHLAWEFGVSKEALAIRIEELGLVINAPPTH